MDAGIKETLIGWAEEYNDPKYFQEDPIIFSVRDRLQCLFWTVARISRMKHLSIQEQWSSTSSVLKR